MQLPAGNAQFIAAAVNSMSPTKRHDMTCIYLVANRECTQVHAILSQHTMRARGDWTLSQVQQGIVSGRLQVFRLCAGSLHVSLAEQPDVAIRDSSDSDGPPSPIAKGDTD